MGDKQRASGGSGQAFALGCGERGWVGETPGLENVSFPTRGRGLCWSDVLHLR